MGKHRASFHYRQSSVLQIYSIFIIHVVSLLTGEGCSKQVMEKGKAAHFKTSGGTKTLPFKDKKALWLWLGLWLICSLPAAAQYTAVKTNMLYDAAAVPNLGLETKIAHSTTLEIWGTYDPITFSGRRGWKNWMIQPEIRKWGCIPFSGPFIGINGLYGIFNLEKVPFGGLEKKRAQGSFYGGGLSLGYHKILSPHWGLETSVSMGFVHIGYARYRCGTCGYKERTFHRNYVGPTRISASLVYLIR